MKNYVLLTGASMGIGLEMAHDFARRGYPLILVARSEGKLASLAAEIQQKNKVDVRYLALDLSLPEAPQQVADFTREQKLPVEILVNNAGFGEFGFFAETEWEKEARMIDLNMRTLTHLTKLYLPEMIARKSGKVLNVASTAAFQPGPTMAVYYATKAYVLSFSEAISNELEGTGVTVTALCPGPTESNFQAAANLDDSKLFKGKKLPSSKEVAVYGIDALLDGKVVAIHGVMNAIMAFSVRFTPRFLVRKLVRAIQAKAH